MTKIRYLGLLLITTLLLVVSTFSQVQKTEKDIETEWNNIFSMASESAIFENGKIKSIRLLIPNANQELKSGFVNQQLTNLILAITIN